MKSKRTGPNRTVLGIGLLIVLAVAVFLLRNRIHFDWRTFVTQLQLADWRMFGLGIALIYAAYCVRAVRWALFLKPTRRVGPLSLFGTQIIGFTAVALFGRVADLVRPYLVSRRTSIPLTSQVAVWAVERIFDFGSNALIFALVLLFAPDRKSLPHPEVANRFALVALAVVLGFAFFAFFVRRAGEKVAGFFRKGIGAFSPKLGENIHEKVLAFRDGLNAIDSFSAFAQATVLSLVMWVMIVYAYLVTLRAFTASPPLHTMTLARCMLLSVVSQGASLVQLPIIGWFTQIGIVAKGIQSLFGAAPEPSLGAATMLLLVTFMSVIPAGLVWSRIEHVSLKKLTEESEHAGEEVVAPAAEREFVPEA